MNPLNCHVSLVPSECGDRGIIAACTNCSNTPPTSGLRVRAADLDTLFAEAAACLFSAVVEDLGTRPARAVGARSNSPAPTASSCCSTGCASCCYHFDAEHLLFGRFEVTVRDDGLTGDGLGRTARPGTARAQPRGEGDHLPRAEGRARRRTAGWRK